MSARINVGSVYELSYAYNENTVGALTVTAKVRKPDGTWVAVSLVDNDNVPAGHLKSLKGSYTAVDAGWHVVSYLTDPVGYEAIVKFLAQNVEATASIVVADATSRLL